MGVSKQLRAIDNGFAIVAHPGTEGRADRDRRIRSGRLRRLPDATNPDNAYRNGTMYSSYTAEQIARTYELADLHGVNLLGAVTWAFEFEDQPYFDGFRDLGTNGVDKPVLNVFRMLGQMRGDRVAVDEHRRASARCRARHRRARARRHRRAGERRTIVPCSSGTTTTTTCRRLTRRSS